jgi:phytoene dehydrogenase-like protein
MSSGPQAPPDILVVGAGYNGLLCALVLARSGMTVHVVDDRPVVGGVHRTEFPFANAPRLATFTGAHRLGFVPPNLGIQLGMRLPLAPRVPSLFVPSNSGFLLADAGNDALVGAVATTYGEAPARSLAAMHEELDALVKDLEPAWLAGPMPVEEIADRFVRRSYREALVNLVRGSAASYLARFGIDDDRLVALLAFDALSGSFAAPTAPNTGFPLLLRHAARSMDGGADAIAVGGPAALARAIADAAIAAGATIASSQSVTQILVEGNCAAGVVLADGSVIRATTIVSGADPVRFRATLSADLLPAETMKRIDALAPQAGVVRLHLALARLPSFACLREDRGQHRATTFLFAPSGASLRAFEDAINAASENRFVAPPAIECIFPTASEPSLRDDEGRHAVSILLPWAPYDLAGTTWAAEEERVTSAILALLDAYAPGTSALVVDAVLHHPKKIETHFGITRGHLAHVDETHAFGDRMPYATPASGLYTCGRASAPAGGILGVPGFNAARRVLADLELGLETTAVELKD